MKVTHKIWLLGIVGCSFALCNLSHICGQTLEQIIDGPSNPKIGKVEVQAPQNVQVGENPQTGDTPQAEQILTGIVRVGSALNIRTSPWGKITGVFHDGDQVNILALEGDWYKISLNGQIAYIHANYVQSSLRKAGITAVRGGPQQAAASRTQSDSGEKVILGEGRFGGPFSQPSPTHVSSEFGPRDLFGRTFHNGIDFPMANGTRLDSMGDGKIIGRGWEPAGGNFVVIRYDNGLTSTYCHLQSSTVNQGQRISQGQQIGISDNTGQSTGPHLHLAFKSNGNFVNPRSVPGVQIPPRRS